MELHSQIEQDLRGGLWGTEGRLPSYRFLTRHYDCSLTVVQQAASSLGEEGLIDACRGRGTFWPSSQPGSAFKQNRIMGVTYLNACFREELEDIKDHWLSRGWFIAGHNAERQLQDPAMERQFVLQARAEHFTGIVLLATPWPNQP